MENPSKKTKIIYWVTTGLLALFIVPGIFFANSEMAIKGTESLGMPLWFHWELSIGKFLGGLILILPFLPKRLKEWAYVAFGIDFISAAIGAISVFGMTSPWYFPLIMLVLLIISYVSFLKLYKEKA